MIREVKLLEESNRILSERVTALEKNRKWIITSLFILKFKLNFNKRIYHTNYEKSDYITSWKI